MITNAHSIDATSHDFKQACPVCPTKDPRRTYRFDNFDVLSCDNCGTSWRSDMYDDNALTDIYCSDDYVEHPYFDQRLDDSLPVSEERLKNFEHGFDVIEASTEVGRHLDVGAASGSVIAIAARRGWKSEGVEMSPGLANAARNKHNAKIHVGKFEDVALEPGSFDALTFWDIIEHVIDPVTVIQRARSLLSKNGVILFCTPDESSWLAKTGHALYRIGYRYPALALHPENHTYFFERTNFERILEACDLDVVSVYSQSAYFGHSPLASSLQKVAIAGIEKISSYADRQYEMVFVAKLRGG